jgi:tripartite-type tricarboxylate transporter receptor subunit TctC
MRARDFAAALAGFAISIVLMGVARAEYPERMIRVLVTTAPGTSGDLVARLMAPKVSERLKQPVILENKAGANGNLAAGEVARSEPDGYTVLVIPSGTLVANLFLYPKSSSAALAGLSPITRLVANDFLIAVRPGLDVKTLQDLLAYSRSNPGKLSLGTSSLGSYPNLAAEMLRQSANIDVLIAKFNGEAAAATAAAGGHVDAVIAASSALESFISGGNLMPLASTGSQRSSLRPNLPTAMESGVDDYSILGFIAVAVPVATPVNIQTQLREAFAEASRDPRVKERLQAMHFTPVSDTSEQVEGVIAAERARLGAVIKRMGGAIE